MAYITLAGPNVLGLRSCANAHGVEWHHAAGHSKGREVISFFPKNSEEEEKIDRLAELVEEENERLRAERKALKEKGLPNSKAALWRHLAENGKYGFFVPSFGEPDGQFFFDSPEIAEVAKKFLKL